MGLLDEITGAAGQGNKAGALANEQGKVAGGFLESLQQHPGGLAAVIDQFRNHGMDQHVQQWQSGKMQQATPEQVQTGLGGTGLIEQTAQKAGVSPEVAKVALAVILPVIMAHMTRNGQAAPPSNQGEFGGMARSLLSRFL